MCDMGFRERQVHPSAPGRFCIPVCLSRCTPQGDGGPLEFPGYPYAYMPRSTTPVVSFKLAMTFKGLCLPTRKDRRLSPDYPWVSSRTTNIQFSGLSHAAYTLATPGFTHTLSAMHAGLLQIRRLTSSGGNWTVACLHPLGNIIQFHEIRFRSQGSEFNSTRLRSW